MSLHEQPVDKLLESNRVGSLACWVAGMMRPQRASVVLLGFLVISNAVLAGVADPLAIKSLLDSLNGHHIVRFLSLTAVLFLFVAMLRQLAAWIERLTQSLSAAISRKLVVQSLHGFYRMPYGRIAKEDSGYFVTRIADDTAQLAGIVSQFVQLLQSCAICVAAFVVCLWLSWKTALLLCMIVPVLRFAAIRYRKKIGKAAADASEREARLKEMLGRAVESFRTVWIFHRVAPVVGQVEEKLTDLLSANQRQVRHASAFKAVSGTLLSFSELSILIASGIAVLRGTLTFGGMFGFLNAYTRAMGSAENLIALIPLLTAADTRRWRVSSLMNLPVNEPPSLPSNTASYLEASNISLQRGGRILMRNIALQGRPGNRILIHGPNGCGKTTLAHTLCGLLPVNDGRLQVPPLERISALLTPFYFVPGSLRNNLGIAIGNTNEEARFARLSDEVGLSVSLDQDPTHLSEGQKRKCQVIMTLMKDADLYLFDEPLSNVDAASCTPIMHTIFAQAEDRILIVIMHGGDAYRTMFDAEIDLSHTNGSMDQVTYAEDITEVLSYEG